MADPVVEREWRRILARLRRQGVQKTCEHIICLINRGPYPLAFTTRVVEHLLKRGEYDAAGTIIKAVDRSGATHALMDELHSSWLWCIGKRRAALAFAVRKARFWKKSYMVHHAGTLYRAMADRENSEYCRKKSDHYWKLAATLVKREEQRDAEHATRAP